MPAKKENKKDEKHSISRRSFLKGFGSGAVTAAVIPSSVSAIKKKETVEAQEMELEKGVVNLIVNGKVYKIEVESREILADTLRKRLNLTGTKIMCNQGACGACTVLIDGIPVYSCMTLTMDVNNREIATIEGLASDGKLHPVQAAFIEKDGMQCGFCTPGQIMSAVSLLEKNPNPTLEDVKLGMSGNLCRCGSYQKIFESVLAAAKMERR